MSKFASPTEENLQKTGIAHRDLTNLCCDLNLLNIQYHSVFSTFFVLLIVYRNRFMYYGWIDKEAACMEHEDERSFSTIVELGGTGPDLYVSSYLELALQVIDFLLQLSSL